jgi:Mitochondrial ribosomal subunit S27
MDQAEGVSQESERASSTLQQSQESIEQIRSRIFGTYVGDGTPTGRKFLRKKLVGEKVASYYGERIERFDPFLIDVDAERCALRDATSSGLFLY